MLTAILRRMSLLETFVDHLLDLVPFLGGKLASMCEFFDIWWKICETFAGFWWKFCDFCSKISIFGDFFMKKLFFCGKISVFWLKNCDFVNFWTETDPDRQNFLIFSYLLPQTSNFFGKNWNFLSEHSAQLNSFSTILKVTCLFLINFPTFYYFHKSFLSLSWLLVDYCKFPLNSSILIHSNKANLKSQFLFYQKSR